jgi:hypothetical protein
VGGVPTPAILKNQMHWAWFMVWADLRRASKPEVVRELFNDPHTLSREDTLPWEVRGQAFRNRHRYRKRESAFGKLLSIAIAIPIPIPIPTSSGETKETDKWIRLQSSYAVKGNKECRMPSS